MNVVSRLLIINIITYTIVGLKIYIPSKIPISIFKN